MALDFHNLVNHELIFSFSETEFNLLNDIFTQYFYRTGVNFDYYQDQRLSIENQKLLCKIVDDYVQKTDLNSHKAQSVKVIEFQSLLKFCIARNYDLVVLAD